MFKLLQGILVFCWICVLPSSSPTEIKNYYNITEIHTSLLTDNLAAGHSYILTSYIRNTVMKEARYLISLKYDPWVFWHLKLQSN